MSEAEYDHFQDGQGNDFWVGDVPMDIDDMAQFGMDQYPEPPYGQGTSSVSHSYIVLMHTESASPLASART